MIINKELRESELNKALNIMSIYNFDIESNFSSWLDFLNRNNIAGSVALDLYNEYNFSYEKNNLSSLKNYELKRKQFKERIDKISEIYKKWFLKISALIEENNQCKWLNTFVRFMEKDIEYKIEAVSNFSLNKQDTNNFVDKLFFTVRELNKIYEFKYTTTKELFLKKKDVYSFITCDFETIIYQADYKHFSNFSIETIKAVYLEMFSTFYSQKLNKEANLKLYNYSEEEKLILLDYYQKLLKLQKQNIKVINKEKQL